MERIDKNTIMPLRGETEENILEFEDVFGVKFGAAAKIRQNMGVRNRDSENPGVICIHFKTGNVTEINVGFTTVMSPMAFVIYKDILKLIISDHPWAFPDEAGNVIEDNQSVMTFVSGDGKDPRKNHFTMGYGPKPGGGYGMVKIPTPPRPDGGLKPNTDYYFTYRLPRNDGDIFAQNIQYRGTDEEEYGGEVKIDLTPLTGELTGYQVDLGVFGGKGVFIPD